VTFDEMKAFEGRECTVTLAVEPKLIEISGTLLELTPDGDADIRLPNGQIIMVWPVLDIREGGK